MKISFVEGLLQGILSSVPDGHLHYIQGSIYSIMHFVRYFVCHSIGYSISYCVRYSIAQIYGVFLKVNDKEL